MATYEQLETKAKQVMAFNEQKIDEMKSAVDCLVTKTKAKIADLEDHVNDLEDKFDGELARLKTPRLYGDPDAGHRPEDKEFAVYLRKGVVSDRLEQKALTVGDGPSGGVLAPPQFSQRLIDVITEFSPIRQAGATVVTCGGESLKIPKRTSIGVARWTGEVALRAETTEPVFGLETLTPHEMYRLILVSQQMIEDSAIDLTALLAQDAGKSFAVLEGTGAISGTGAGNEMEGLLTNTEIEAAKVKTGSATAILADNLVAVPDQLKSGYLANAKWIMHRKTWAAIKQLKAATTNAYLFIEPGGAPVPTTLLGYPVILSPDMPSTLQQNAQVILFGDFGAAYTIVDRIQTQIQRLYEKYIEYGEVGFYCRRRIAGQVVLAEAVVKVYCSA